MNDAREPEAVPAHDRAHDEVLDRETGAVVSLAQFLGKSRYGEIVESKRVALENDLLEGKARYACPWCAQPMVLRARRVEGQVRFYFKHRFDTGECSGTRGLSPAAICAAKFAHSKEGPLHKRLKAMLAESLDADGSFSQVDTEKRWKAEDGVHWRQPDVQAVHHGHRVAFEVQLATTFLHVIAGRMTFYRRNQGRLLWLFRDLEVGAFRLAEDDVFYANNRNAFRITEETVARSQATGRFALECVWMRPTVMDAAVVDVVTRQIVHFDELTFDVGASGAPRAYYFDYDTARAALRADLDQGAQDQALRNALERYMVAFDRSQVERPWLLLRERLVERGIDLPMRLGGEDGPFYLLQAAYSAKLGRPVACRLHNLMAMAHNLFDRHKDTLWAFTVLLGHYGNGKVLVANGNMGAWKHKRDAYRRAWLANDPAFAPDRRFDDLLAFAFPEVADLLRRSPSDPDAQRLARQGAQQQPR